MSIITIKDEQKALFAIDDILSDEEATETDKLALIQAEIDKWMKET